MAKKKLDSARRMTPLPVLKDLVKLSTACADRAQRASGEIGQAIKDASEHKFLNPKAFKLAMQLLKVGQKDAVKLAFLLEDFDHYREQLKIDDMAATKLPLGEVEDAELAGKTNGSGKRENPLRAAAKKSDQAVKDSVKVMNLADARAKKKAEGSADKTKH